MNMDSRLRDYKWSLIFSAKEKVYILTEHRRIGDEWTKLTTTEWSRMSEALQHMEHTNTRRLMEVAQS